MSRKDTLFKPTNRPCHYRVRNANGVSMTNASGAPYTVNHGQPRVPNQPNQPNYIGYGGQPGGAQQIHFPQTAQPQAAPSVPANGAYTNNGFTPVSLSVPVSAGAPIAMPQTAMPMQPIRPIQPVQVGAQFH